MEILHWLWEGIPALESRGTWESGEWWWSGGGVAGTQPHPLAILHLPCCICAESRPVLIPSGLQGPWGPTPLPTEAGLEVTLSITQPSE